MGRLIFYDMLDKPVTTIIIGICSAIWLYVQKKGLGYSNLGVSYDAVVSGGQHWRLLTSSFTHISFLHLIFNMSSLWSLGVVESLANLGLGIRFYLHNTLVLLILSSLLVLGIYHILIHQFKLDYYRQVTAVGYSCVVFGWMTILAVKRPSSKLNLFGVLSLPISYAPFESLVFTSIIVPQASFLGHLSGILVGYLVAWNVFQGMNDYWAVTTFTWMLLLFIVSLKRTTRYDLPFLEIDQTIPSVGLAGPIPLVEEVVESSPLVGSDLV
jgi:membrane associated rhomboid family serine protease